MTTLPEVSVVKCACGHPGCHAYGLSYGSFFQGCGWSREDAEEIARRINGYEDLAARAAHVTKEKKPL